MWYGYLTKTNHFASFHLFSPTFHSILLFIGRISKIEMWCQKCVYCNWWSLVAETKNGKFFCVLNTFNFKSMPEICMRPTPFSRIKILWSPNIHSPFIHPFFLVTLGQGQWPWVMPNICLHFIWIGACTLYSMVDDSYKTRLTYFLYSAFFFLLRHAINFLKNWVSDKETVSLWVSDFPCNHTFFSRKHIKIPNT